MTSKPKMEKAMGSGALISKSPFALVYFVPAVVPGQPDSSFFTGERYPRIHKVKNTNNIIQKKVGIVIKVWYYFYMNYGKIVKGTFISRPNRFIAYAEVKEDGQAENKPVRSHVKNTGRLKELLVPGAAVYLEDFAENMGGRKLRYSLIGVEKNKGDGGRQLINIDSQAPNKVVAEALNNGVISLPSMGRLTQIKGEKTWGDSRFDFYVEDEQGKKGLIEVKGVTLEKEGIALFPDAPTERGVKHINGLAAARRAEYLTYIIFVIQMEGIKEFRPNDEMHPAFGAALRQAREIGVSIMAYFCHVEKDRLQIAGSLPVNLEEKKIF